MDDRICLKLQQRISKISFPSIMKSCLVGVFSSCFGEILGKEEDCIFSGLPCSVYDFENVFTVDKHYKYKYKIIRKGTRTK